MSDPADTKPASPDPEESPAMTRLRALLVAMGFDVTSRTPPDPLVLCERLLEHMPEVAALLVFALEQDGAFMAAIGGTLTSEKLDGLILVLERLCDELGVIAARRATEESAATREATK